MIQIMVVDNITKILKNFEIQKKIESYKLKLKIRLNKQKLISFFNK